MVISLPRWPFTGPRESELLAEVLASPQWGGFHPIVKEFEDRFAAYQGARFGISAVNGTVTLELLLAVLGIGPGDEVIVPAISFISTASAVSRTGAVPVFVDIETDSFQMCPRAARAAVTEKTRAVLTVHFGGSLSDVAALGQLCREKGILLLEDAAHAHGSEWNGQRAGSFGVASSFSFQNGKVLTAGEGGMVLTSDEDLAGRMRSYANQGRRPGHSFFHHFETGNNFRLSGLHAAILTAQLERLDEQIALRSRNRSALAEMLSGLDAIRWQEIPRAVNRNSWYLVLGRVVDGNRDRFCEALRESGLPCTPFYPHTLYANPMYTDGGVPCRVEPCPNAEARIGDAFWIGFRALMGDEAMTAQVAEAIRAAAQFV